MHADAENPMKQGHAEMSVHRVAGQVVFVAGGGGGASFSIRKNTAASGGSIPGAAAARISLRWMQGVPARRRPN